MNYANIDIIAHDGDTLLAVISDNPYRYVVGIELDDGEISESKVFTDILKASVAYTEMVSTKTNTACSLQ